MDARRDPAQPLAAVPGGLYEMAAAHAPEARVTPAQFVSEPVSPNTVPARIAFSVDMRHPDAGVLAEMDAALRGLVAAAAQGAEVLFRAALQLAGKVDSPALGGVEELRREVSESGAAESAS